MATQVNSAYCFLMPSGQITNEKTLTSSHPKGESSHSLHRRFNVVPNVRSVSDHDGVVVLDIRKGQMLGMNEIGREVWQGVQLGQELNEIVDHICGLTGAERAVVEQDVLAFSQDLLAQGLVVEVLPQ
jgi:hypothetical protein